MAIFFLSTGLAILLLGIHVISSGLSKASGPRLQGLLRVCTKTPTLGLISGIAGSALTQSSSLVTVLLVSLVHSKLLTYQQAFGVMLGANIGTTFTLQLVAFSPKEYALPIFILGLVISLVFTRGYPHYLGLVLLGCGSIFVGFNILELAFHGLENDPAFRQWLAYLARDQYHGIVLGIVITAVIQSSSILLSIVAAMAREGLLDLTTAIALCLGANMGTCVTTIIASIGTGTAAKRTAMAHLLFNIWGVLVILPFIPQFVTLVAKTAVDPAFQVANAHTLFNLVTGLLALPITNWFVSMVKLLVPDKRN